MYRKFVFFFSFRGNIRHSEFLFTHLSISDGTRDCEQNFSCNFVDIKFITNYVFHSAKKFQSYRSHDYSEIKKKKQKQIISAHTVIVRKLKIRII